MTIEDPGAPPADDGEFWLFGYGSLIWKPPPHFDQRIPGWVNGYVRRFWQASQDHRGTPEKPGRVVTLIERSFWSTLEDPHPAPEDGKVWGVAYRIIPDRVAEVKAYLDIREINGYSIHYTAFHPAPSSSSSSSSTTATHPGPIRTLVYIGTPDNDQFTGPQDIQALAEHIHRSVGPSGLNREYLLHLDAALRDLGPESGDEHITDLSERVRAIMARGGGEGLPLESVAANGTLVAPGGRPSALPEAGPAGAVNEDEQEETEKPADLSSGHECQRERVGA